VVVRAKNDSTLDECDTVREVGPQGLRTLQGVLAAPPLGPRRDLRPIPRRTELSARRIKDFLGRP
jgi:hypothetical protein